MVSVVQGAVTDVTRMESFLYTARTFGKTGESIVGGETQDSESVKGSSRSNTTDRTDGLDPPEGAEQGEKEHQRPEVHGRFPDSFHFASTGE